MPFDGWKFDVARAFVTTILFIAAIALGLSLSFLYGGGLPGTFPLLFAFFIGPWAAAWISCKLLPSPRPRMVLRLSAGIFSGFIVWWIAIGLVSLLPEWPAGDRFIAPHEASLALVIWSAFLFAGALALSRWRR